MLVSHVRNKPSLRRKWEARSASCQHRHRERPVPAAPPQWLKSVVAESRTTNHSEGWYRLEVTGVTFSLPYLTACTPTILLQHLCHDNSLFLFETLQTRTWSSQNVWCLLCPYVLALFAMWGVRFYSAATKISRGRSLICRWNVADRKAGAGAKKTEAFTQGVGLKGWEISIKWWGTEIHYKWSHWFIFVLKCTKKCWPGDVYVALQSRLDGESAANSVPAAVPDRKSVV